MKFLFVFAQLGAAAVVEEVWNTMQFADYAALAAILDTILTVNISS